MPFNTPFPFTLSFLPLQSLNEMIRQIIFLLADDIKEEVHLFLHLKFNKNRLIFLQTHQLKHIILNHGHFIQNMVCRFIVQLTD